MDKDLYIFIYTGSYEDDIYVEKYRYAHYLLAKKTLCKS